MSEIKRCSWSESSDLDREYYDTKWGKPLYDEQELFEMLILEGKQAGLSWSTILHKRETLNKAFDNFDPHILVTYDDEKIEALLQDPGIIRNRLKVKAVIANAHAYFKLCEEFESLSNYLWGFIDHKPIINEWHDIKEVPATSDVSDALSKDLKKRGFKFVGSTTIYAYMQGIGMVNDHVMDCSFRGV